MNIPYAKDRNHALIRNILRVSGVILLILGVIMTVIGLASVLHSSGKPPSFGPRSAPDNSWYCLVGIPLMAVGGAVLQAGFMGFMAKYSADEVTPTIGKSAEHIAGGMAGAITGEMRGLTKQRLEDLEKLQREGLVSDAEYRDKRKAILECL